MSEVTSPVILDSTGLEIVEALKALRRRQIQVVSLDETPLTAHAAVMEAEGVPQYVEDVSLFSAYGLTETGWYIFARIYAGGKIKVDASTTVSGAAGYIATPGEDHVDVAVRFEVAAMGRKVTVSWGGFADAIVFRATDLAIRNLDYMVTNYTYDLAPYAVWEYQLASGSFEATKSYFVKDAEGSYVKAEVTAGEAMPTPLYEENYALTEDETFAEGKTYYTEEYGAYSEATVTPGESVPAGTYYEKSYALVTGTLSSNKTYYTLSGSTYSPAALLWVGGEIAANTYYEAADESYALTGDETFQAGKTYYTESGGTYTPVTLHTDGENGPVLYYNHSKLTLRGMVKNVTYELNEKVDCGIEIELPEIPEDGHGAWFEFHLLHAVSGSITLKPPEGVKGGTAGASASITAGLNVVDLHYTHAAGVKLWSLANVHTNIPA